MIPSKTIINPALLFLQKHLGQWMAYMGVRAAFTLAALLALTLVMVLGRLVSSAVLPFMFFLPPLFMLGARPLLRRWEWKWMSEFLLGKAIPPPRKGILLKSWWTLSLKTLALSAGEQGDPEIKVPPDWRMQYLVVYGLILLPFMVVAVAMAWGLSWPLVTYTLLTAWMVGGGFAAGGVVPVLALILVVRAFPGKIQLITE